MARKDNKRKKRILNLAIIFTFTAIVFGSATYAWFIGMRTVNVNPFEVEIAATEDLQLSLDGIHWSDTVSINKDNYMNPNTSDPNKNNRTDESNKYPTNTNNWAGRGLIPVSTVGEIDTTASRMKLYEKGSLTATKGGYRLMASRVPNFEVGSNPDGYVVFDLFIKNSSGTEYYPTYNELNEEAIYLTTDSKVKVGSTGVADAGIENSVRVAFAQIGRVKAPTTAETQATPTVAGDPSISTVQGITCASTTSGEGQNAVPVVTGICRTATIWEPNDTDHVANALTWYNTTCTQRSGASTSDAASYGAAGTCSTVVNGQAYHTYAIAKEVRVENGVDVYDGADYNKYTADVTSIYADAIDITTTTTEVGGQQVTTNNGKYLYQVPYFTDTMKLQRGTARPQFMSLAPNSVTKVRVYIYLEGQDIDNYDFASIGKQISVNFGFTKERFVEDDINYNGPVLNQGEGPNKSRTDIIADLTEELGVAPTEAQIIEKLKTIDKTAPVITLSGSQDQTITKGGTFTQPTITGITDNLTTYTHDTQNDADEWYGPEGSGIQASITGTVNKDVVGKYRILYEVKDEAGNLATEVVTVEVTESSGN
jgi:hypothetical protein